jgi:outer membrane protein OmpA-like peptidoglycan-associated protein
MDDRAERLEDELDDTTIERVGEGILVTFDSGILFGFDSAVLQSAARANLADLARVLAEDSEDYELLVAGHTDSSGAQAYNQTLSERRAAAASNFLATRGIPSSQIRTEGLGETEPVASNDSAQGESANRRVEIAIFASAEYRDQANRQARN